MVVKRDFAAIKAHEPQIAGAAICKDTKLAQQLAIALKRKFRRVLQRAISCSLSTLKSPAISLPKYPPRMFFSSFLFKFNPSALVSLFDVKHKKADHHYENHAHRKRHDERAMLRVA